MAKSPMGVATDILAIGIGYRFSNVLFPIIVVTVIVINSWFVGFLAWAFTVTFVGSVLAWTLGIIAALVWAAPQSWISWRIHLITVKHARRAAGIDNPFDTAGRTIRGRRAQGITAEPEKPPVYAVSAPSTPMTVPDLREAPSYY